MGSQMVYVLTILSLLCLSSGEIHNVVRSEDFDGITASKEIVVISFIRTKPYDDMFQNDFREAGNYLQDFGVHFGTVDCVSDPDTEYCPKAEASKNVYIFRNGKFFLTLARDTLFDVDSIVANILHLVLLVEVPIISEHADLQARQETHTGQRDIILGYMPAVGLTADRAFMEVAFAYRHKYAFLMTTSRELLAGHSTGSSDLSQSPRPHVFTLQCSMTESGQPCPWAQYLGPITIESLAMMMKTLQHPTVIDLTTSGSTNPFMEHGISAVYVITDPSHYEQALSAVIEISDEFRGNLGFVIVYRDDVDMIDLDLQPSSDAECNPTCCILRGHKEDIISDNIHDGVELRKFMWVNTAVIFGHLVKPAGEGDEGEQMYWGEEEDGDGGGDTEDEPEQERQDDRVQEATVHLRLSPRNPPKESPVNPLTDKTFQQFTGQSQLTGVLFTMRWNPRSLAFLQSFESAAQTLNAIYSGDQNASPLAQVECSSWPDVCDKSNVTVYPTVKMYRERVNVATYGGILEERSFLRSYLLHNLPSPLEISSAESMEGFIKGSFPAPWIKDYLDSVTLAVIPGGFSNERDIFREVAQELKGKHLLGLCTSACLQQRQESKESQPSILVYKWNDPLNPQQRFEGDWTTGNLLAFIKDAALPVLPELTASNMPTYLSRGVPFVILFHAGDPISDKAAVSLRQIAGDKDFNHFVLCQMNSSQENTVGSQTLATYGFLPTPDQSTVVILDHSAGEVCRYPEGKVSSPPSLKSWLEAADKGSRMCSEGRALINREWKPLVPPYDYLKMMDDEEHLKVSGRRGLKTHSEEVASSEEEGEENADGEYRGEKEQGESVVMMEEGDKKKEKQMQQKHEHQHTDL